MATSDSCMSDLFVDALSGKVQNRRVISRERFELFYNAFVIGAELAAYLAAILISLLIFPGADGIVRGSLRQVLAFGIIGGVATTASLHRRPGYGRSNSLSRILETERVLRACSFSMALLLLIDIGLVQRIPWTVFVVASAGAPLLLIPLGHFCTHLKQRLHSHGYGIARAVVYAGEACESCVSDRMLSLELAGIRCVGRISGWDLTSGISPPSLTVKENVMGLRSGSLTVTLRSLCCDLLVIQNASCISPEQLEYMTKTAEEAGVAILFIEDIAPVPSHIFNAIESDDIRLSTPVQLQQHFLVQRMMDLVIASCLLLLCLPVLFGIGILIRIDSPGPALFMQERVGRGGRFFRIFKFRSMLTTAPKYEASPRTSGDPRLTRVGRVLRRLSLDELPQLINVLIGDMSLVGPRPEMGFLVERHRALHHQRLWVTPGITGLWQLSPGRARPIHENIQQDLYYIRNRNFFLDLAILIHTAFLAAGDGM